MTSPDPVRRRVLVLVGSCVSVLAGCGEPNDESTPAPAPPPNATGTPGEALGPGPEGADGTPMGNETIRRGTGTPGPSDVVFSKPGGGEVSATVYGTGSCGVVLVPQTDRDRQSWDRYATRLADDGYVALAIDEGETRKTAGVQAAIRYMHEHVGVETLAVIGASAGGETAVRASATRQDAVDGLVTLSAAGGVDVAGQLTMPSMFVVAEGDGERFVSTARALAERSPGKGAAVTYEGRAHGQELLESPIATQLRSRLGVFLSTVCPPEATAQGTATSPSP